MVVAREIPRHVKTTLFFISLLLVLDFVLNFLTIMQIDAIRASDSTDDLKKIVGVQAALAVLTWVALILVLIESVHFKTGNHMSLLWQFRFLLIFGLSYLVMTMLTFFTLVLYKTASGQTKLLDGFGVEAKVEGVLRYDGWWSWESRNFPIIIACQKILFVMHFWLVKTAVSHDFRNERLYLNSRL